MSLSHFYNSGSIYFSPSSPVSQFREPFFMVSWFPDDWDFLFVLGYGRSL